MLKVSKSRQIVAEFFATEDEQEKLVKTTVVNIDHTAVSTVSETLHGAELYAKYRKDMRKDEQELRNMRYQIEDEILAELEAAPTKEKKG
jgi:aspartate/tyrosine/aromatic aminotransferase